MEIQILNSIFKGIMARENSRRTFTISEYQQIRELVNQLQSADASKQKGIRAKIRKIGLYWSEVANGVDYTVANLERLVTEGVIDIVDRPCKPVA